MSHSTTPAEKVSSMAQERSSQRLLRHACKTCGTKDIVVNVPAAKPSNVVKGMSSSLSQMVQPFISAFDRDLLLKDLKIIFRQLPVRRHLLIKLCVRLMHA